MTNVAEEIRQSLAQALNSYPRIPQSRQAEKILMQQMGGRLTELATNGEPSIEYLRPSHEELINRESRVRFFLPGIGVYLANVKGDGIVQVVEEEVSEVQIALTVACPVCHADVGCLCDQFTAPNGLPFDVHQERVSSARLTAPATPSSPK